MAKMNNVNNVDIQIHVTKAIAKALKDERKRVSMSIKEMAMPEGMTKKSADQIRKNIRAALSTAE